MKMGNWNKTQLYWTCQLVGWTGIVVQQMLALEASGRLEGKLLAFPLLIYPFGIGLTHVYRRVFRRLRLGEKDTTTLLWTGGVAVLALSCAMFLTHHHFGHVLSETPEDYSFIHIAVNLAFWAPVFFGWVAVYHLDKILGRLHHTEVSGLNAANSLKDSQLQSLRAQINPHFLFNALNSIRALTYSEPARAAEAVGQLSDLLRSTLHTPPDGLHRLRDELAFADDYLQLEKIRFEERLHWQTDIPTDLLAQSLPALLLLTLVENAVKHGISTLPEGGHIRIAAQARPDGWQLTVFNSGVLHTAPLRPDEGLGLDNLRRRLHYFYGEKAQLRLEVAEGGVLATVQINLHAAQQPSTPQSGTQPLNAAQQPSTRPKADST
jgi:two-component system, LytTR family, sensor kinase